MVIKLSIITINLNNVIGLRKTIESVINQLHINLEYIIIDGGSTDGSLEVIKGYADKISYWISEPDNGIYNAMNKGIKSANGEYCLFLNSGDWLADENIVSDFCKSGLTEDIIAGNMFYYDQDKTILAESVSAAALDFELFYFKSLPHPATFIKRELFATFGLYNETYRIVSDWEFWLRTLVLNNCTYNHIDLNIAYFDGGGISNLKENELLIKQERDAVFKSFLPLVYKSYTSIRSYAEFWRIHEDEYREYLNLKNGKLGFLIRLMLFIKKKKQQFLHK
jgi:glycosyltransferase involved in cell wall biosynthesis